MNDDPERVTGPAAGMQAADRLRADRDQWRDRAIAAELLAARWYNSYCWALDLGIRCAFDFADYADEVDGRKDA